MKKTLLFLCVICISISSAQNADSTIVPHTKDWGMSIDAIGLLRSIRSNTATTQGLMFRYFKAPDKAYRLTLRFGYNNYTSRERVEDRVAATSSVEAYPAPEATKENVWRRTTVAGGLAFGTERRRGAKKLQGIYGAEVGVFFSNTRDNFTYGNALNPGTQNLVEVDADDAMSSSVHGNANNIDTVPLIQGVVGAARVISRNHGFAVSAGARAFLGAEYFFLPKMSLGAEFGWGLGFTTSGRTETTVESIGVSTVSGNSGASSKRSTLDGGNEVHIRLDNDRQNFPLGGFSGLLRLNLYF